VDEPGSGILRLTAGRILTFLIATYAGRVTSIRSTSVLSL
jgi:hypothetical protein